MNKKAVVSLLTLSLGLALSGCSGSSGTGNIKNLSPKEAKVELETYYKDIKPEKVKLERGVAPALDKKDELPDIDASYPFTIEGDGQVDAEIFVSSEKAGSGQDGILNELADEFNRKNIKIDGETISVSIRSIPSGTALDYISSKKHTPDGYSPSNEQWGYMLQSKGVQTEKIATRLFGNTSGFLMKDSVYQEIKSSHGDVNVESVIKAVNDGKLLGYTNPYSSSTGLSLLSELLYSFDVANPISEESRQKFSQFQANIPTTFVTTTQLREAAKGGTADILSISYQTYINTPEFSEYKYVPFGVRQDSPLYATSKDSKKKEVLKEFAEFVLSENSQKKATDYGFNALEDYTFADKTTDGKILTSMQNLWKKNKNASRPIVGVFVADVSGSMDGDPINNLRKSLLNSLQYINEDNKIGLVTYASDVYIDVPIAPMTGEQRGYFTTAINNMVPLDGTATYDGTLVAVKMIMDELEKNPDARPVVFLLSDGRANEGHSYERAAAIIKALGITVHTIGYNADLDELKKLSQINESVSIDASSEDVIYKIKELFNAEF